MFPINGYVTRPLPSLLPGSDGTPSPVFHRYYEAATTTVVAHPALRFSNVAPSGLELTSRFHSPAPGSRRLRRLGVVDRFHPFPVPVPKETYGSPKFPASPSDLCRALGPRSAPRAQVVAALRHGPRNCNCKGTHQICLSRLYHTASVIAVYASCRPRGRRRKTRFRWLTGLSGWAFPCPQSSFGEFHTFALPSPRASLGAKQFSLWIG